MAKNDMTAPFVLGLIGGILILIVGLIASIAGAVLGGIAGGLIGAGGLGAAIGAAVGIWGIIVGILIIIGSVMMRGKNAKAGSVLTLIFGILGFFTPALGLVIGPILAIVGGAIGISKAK